MRANKERLRRQYLESLEQELEDVDAELATTRDWVLSLNLTDLIDALRQEKVTALSAVNAYRWKALQCHKQLNCCTDFIKEASDWAAALDEKWAGHAHKPPLFGVPFSVKDNFHMVGYPCSRGLSKELEFVATEEFSIVTHLRSLGAVPFVRTNVPQTLLSFVCSNPVYGTTLHPLSANHTPGGSSGGEAALLAAGGSPFGIGSDLGGSLRIPAHFCGVITLKPTSGRLTAINAHPGVPGVGKVHLGYGFFTKTVKDLELLMSLTLHTSYFERIPLTAPLPFKKMEAKKKFRIGYCLQDGWFPSTPSCERAVRDSVTRLRERGQDMVPFAIPNAKFAMEIVLKAMLADNGAYTYNCFRYEDVDPYLKATYYAMKVPLWIRGLLSKLLFPWPRLQILLGSYNRGLSDLRATHAALDDYVKQFIQLIQKEKLDGFIMPVLPTPALPHQYPARLVITAFSTFLFNGLNFPAGVVPVTKVTAQDLKEMSTYPNTDPTEKMVHEAMRIPGAEGLPVGVQIVTLPWREELCLELMRLVEEVKD